MEMLEVKCENYGKGIIICEEYGSFVGPIIVYIMIIVVIFELREDTIIICE